MKFYQNKTNSDVIIGVRKIRDLGIISDSKLSFNYNYDYLICNADKMWGFICRDIKSFTQWQSVKLFYDGLIGPKLPFELTVWRTYTKKTLNKFKIKSF